MIHYNRFQTKATINPKDKKISKIESPSDCAEKCDNELKINCKSFNYCPNSKECYLSDRHLVDGFEAGNGNLACDHYSSKLFLSNIFLFRDLIRNKFFFNLKERDYIDNKFLFKKRKIYPRFYIYKYR